MLWALRAFESKAKRPKAPTNHKNKSLKPETIELGRMGSDLGLWRRVSCQSLPSLMYSEPSRISDQGLTVHGAFKGLGLRFRGIRNPHEFRIRA